MGILAGVGGVGGIILGIVKFSTNMIAQRLEEKYIMKLNKELEKYKSELKNKVYISKTMFDTEFSIYRELSKAYFDVEKSIYAMIPYGYATYPADKEVRTDNERACYKSALEAVVFAQDALNSNAPFIPNEFYIKYNEILRLSKHQLGVFKERWNVSNFAPQEEKETLSGKDFMRTKEIQDNLKDLNRSIREYLSKLDVLD